MWQPGNPTQSQRIAPFGNPAIRPDRTRSFASLRYRKFAFLETFSYQSTLTNVI